MHVRIANPRWRDNVTVCVGVCVCVCVCVCVWVWANRWWFLGIILFWNSTNKHILSHGCKLSYAKERAHAHTGVGQTYILTLHQAVFHGIGTYPTIPHPELNSIDINVMWSVCYLLSTRWTVLRKDKIYLHFIHLDDEVSYSDTNIHGDPALT